MNRPTYDPSKWPWVRTCQACGHRISQAEPSDKTKASTAYCYRACSKCGSEAFDFGSHQPFTAEQIAEYEAFAERENSLPEDDPYLK